MDRAGCRQQGSPQRVCRALTRSIPACTGEPSLARRVHPERQVYPRVYGGTVPWIMRLACWSGLSPRVRGTLIRLVSSQSGEGLSPRVRGNRCRGVWIRVLYRSIPACTGEPPWSNDAGATTEVYPRVYGGTRPFPGEPPARQGLSPRVRGNLSPSRKRPKEEGSIPACTGEPSTDDADYARTQVYPRVYGGTCDECVKG